MIDKTLSPLVAGLLGRCPACGKGTLFCGVMSIVPRCPQCGLSLTAQDSGDGPMFFALVIVGFLAVGLASVVELKYSPPLWLHAVIWIPFTFLACVVIMRFFKAWLIAIQFKNRPDSFQ